MVVCSSGFMINMTCPAKNILNCVTGFSKRSHVYIIFVIGSLIEDLFYKLLVLVYIYIGPFYECQSSST